MTPDHVYCTQQHLLQGHTAWVWHVQCLNSAYDCSSSLLKATPLLLPPLTHMTSKHNHVYKETLNASLFTTQKPLAARRLMQT